MEGAEPHHEQPAAVDAAACFGNVCAVRCHHRSATCSNDICSASKTARHAQHKGKVSRRGEQA